MAEIAYWEAIQRAHDEEMANDPLVIAMGEDIGVVGGTYKATSGLYEKYGSERIIDCPISENSYTGIGIGASMIGIRPIIEIMSINFALLALDTLINAAAKIHYMSGGRIACDCYAYPRWYSTSTCGTTFSTSCAYVYEYLWFACSNTTQPD